MRALLQRVSRASVEVNGETIGAIGPGLLVFLGIESHDTLSVGQRLVERVLNYRVFNDSNGRMNLSLADTGQGLLLVSQFTLAADTRKGRRPGFSTAAAPDRAEPMFAELFAYASARHEEVAQGRFGADMQVALVNDGPVTFVLEG